VSNKKQEWKMGQPTSNSNLNLTSPVVNFIVIVLGLAAAYFMTIQSLKIELSAKAEAAVVEALDRKLATIEVLLGEGMVGRERFHRFETAVETRLSKIEFYLTDKPGEQVGKP
jgi:hypothetical protein